MNTKSDLPSAATKVRVSDAVDCRDLIWKLRRRHQMYVLDSVRLLEGFLLGFAIARQGFDFDYVLELRKFAVSRFNTSDHMSLHEIVERNTKPGSSENALFFEVFEAFEKVSPSRVVSYKVLGRNPEVTPRGRYFDEEPPPFVQVADYGDKGIYLFHLDEEKCRSYEMGMSSFDHAENFLRSNLILDAVNL